MADQNLNLVRKNVDFSKLAEFLLDDLNEHLKSGPQRQFKMDSFDFLPNFKVTLNIIFLRSLNNL